MGPTTFPCHATCVRCGCRRLVLADGGLGEGEDGAVAGGSDESRGGHGRRRAVDCNDMIRRALYDAIEKAKLRGPTSCL